MQASRYLLQEVATDQSQRPDLPRSGHCSATLPPEHAADVIVFGGYTETPDKQRQACNDTWVFDGAWSRLQTTGGPPRVRLMHHPQHAPAISDVQLDTMHCIDYILVVDYA